VFKCIQGLLDRVFAVAGAVIFSQIPNFIDQYQQQVTGRMAELQLQINIMERVAATTGKTLKQYILKFLSSTDPDFYNQGEVIQQMLLRFESLVQALNALKEASAFTKAWALICHFDYEIARSTFSSFVVGLSFSLEGFIYAFIGLVFGLSCFFLVKQFVIRIATGLKPNARAVHE
jgi:hypothetical protein